MDSKTGLFEEHRSLLEGFAYRMLGTRTEAEDVVQDTYLKWNQADTKEVRNPRSWLVTVCSRLAMDSLKAARVRRETYHGAWLPEPFTEDQAVNPAERVEIDDTVSVALLLALEQLSASERAAFLLHEIFDYSFEEIGTILGKSTLACRQLGSRARARVKTAKPRFQASAHDHHRLLTAFLHAAHSGDLKDLKSMLAEDVELHADGGGKVLAIAEVLRSNDAVARFLGKVWSQPGRHFEEVHTWFNGMPGRLLYEDGKLATALSVSIDAGRIQRIYAVRNPDKLSIFPEHSLRKTGQGS